MIINALNKGATLLIFDQDLNPSQVKALGELTELKVIDRSQLIWTYSQEGRTAGTERFRSSLHSLNTGFQGLQARERNVPVDGRNRWKGPPAR